MLIKSQIKLLSSTRSHILLSKLYVKWSYFYFFHRFRWGIRCFFGTNLSNFLKNQHIFRNTNKITHSVEFSHLRANPKKFRCTSTKNQNIDKTLDIIVLYCELEAQVTQIKYQKVNSKRVWIRVRYVESVTW